MFNFKSQSHKAEIEEILESLRNVHNEWQEKEKFFQEVTDPDLVDVAIYELEASKMKYAYLLKKLKEEMGIGRIVADQKID